MLFIISLKVSFILKIKFYDPTIYFYAIFFWVANNNEKRGFVEITIKFCDNIFQAISFNVEIMTFFKTRLFYNINDFNSNIKQF